MKIEKISANKIKKKKEIRNEKKKQNYSNEDCGVEF